MSFVNCTVPLELSPKVQILLTVPMVEIMSWKAFLAESGLGSRV